MEMLFPPDVDDRRIPPIPGLVYLPEYVTHIEEAELVRLIDAQRWDTTWERRRQLYGATYGSGGEGSGRPIPEWGQALAGRCIARGSVNARLIRCS